MRARIGFCALIAMFIFQAMAAAAEVSAQPPVEAEAACLIVANTGQVLFGKDENKIMYPASTTKIMTLLVALERGKLDDVVTVSAGDASVEGSSLDLSANDRLTLRDMLYGLMLVSGNDAAEAVAEHIGGSVGGFVAMMNSEAQRLGAVNTHFSNPHGLPDPINHFTTAKDMAMITAYGLKRADFVNYVSTRNKSVRFLNSGLVKPLQNSNKLLATYPGANGVKTGFTNDAGDCLVASAKRNGIQLIAVVFNDDERWTDAANLLDYGFAQMASRQGK